MLEQRLRTSRFQLKAEYVQRGELISGQLRKTTMKERKQESNLEIVQNTVCNSFESKPTLLGWGPRVGTAVQRAGKPLNTPSPKSEHIAATRTLARSNSTIKYVQMHNSIQQMLLQRLGPFKVVFHHWTYIANCGKGDPGHLHQEGDSVKKLLLWHSEMWTM